MYINGHFLGALECRSGGGFHALAGCVAYFCTRAIRKRGETPHQRCYNAPFLGASKCQCAAQGAWRTWLSANISRLAKRPTLLFSQRNLKNFVR